MNKEDLNQGKDSEEGIMATFPSPEDTKKALELLNEKGFEDITLYSPLDPGELGLPVKKLKSPIGRFTLCGVIFGIFAGLFLGGGTAVLYPIETGGMPILSLPPIGIIAFEVMILFSLLATVFGFLYFAIFSADRKRFVPPRISSDRFGVSVQGTRKELASASDLLKRCGADKVEKQIARLWLGIALVLIVPSLVLGFPWSQDMVDQPARDPQEEAIVILPSTVPRHGKSIKIESIDEGPWIENPVPVTDASIQIGKRLFDIFCVICHGAGGKGDGLVSEKIGKFPDFSKDDFLSQPDGCFYVVITNGANFESEIARPRPTIQQASHDEHGDEAEHGHDEEEAHEHEELDLQQDETDAHGHEEEIEHTHDELDSLEVMQEDNHQHEDDNAGHAHEEEVSSVSIKDDHGHAEEDEHGHEDSEHAHEETASMEDEHGEHEHADEDEHAHANGGAQCGASGHDHGGGGGDEGEHAHGSGKKHFMPPYRDSLRPIERWHIVNFMKNGLLGE